MKSTTVNTVACIVSKNKRDFYHKKELYTIQQRAVENGEELFATVDNEDLQWKFDRVVNNTSLLKDECSTLIKSVMKGYNAAHFSLSACDGHRHFMNEQRDQTLKTIFTEFSSAISKSIDPFIIEYAILGLQNGVCYDIRKRFDRTNEAMEARGIDSIMRSVDDIEKIHKLMIDREIEIPHVLSLKLTNTRTKAVGRFSIIDLLYSPFSITVRENTLTSIQNIISALTTPGYTGVMQLGTSFLAKEITKYICGHNELLMTLYLNDKIMNETHSRDTRFLLSLVSSFTGMRVNTLPRAITTTSSEEKRLRSDIKSVSKQRVKFETIHNNQVSIIEEQNAKIKRLEQEINEIEAIPQTEEQEEDEILNFEEMMAYKEKEIEYFKSKLQANEATYVYKILQYKIELAKSEALIDFKEISEEYISERIKKDEAMIEEQVNQPEQRQRVLRLRVNELQAAKEELEKEIEAKVNELGAEEKVQDAEMSPPPIIEVEDEPMDKVVEQPQEPEQPEEVESSEEEVEEVEDPEDEILKSELDALSKEIDVMQEKIKEIGRSQLRLKDHYKDELSKIKQVNQEFEKQHKADKTSIKALANEKMMKLKQRLEEKWVGINEHIENLRNAIREKKGVSNSDDDSESDSESRKVRTVRKKRKISSDNDVGEK